MASQALTEIPSILATVPTARRSAVPHSYSVTSANSTCIWRKWSVGPVAIRAPFSGSIPSSGEEQLQRLGSEQRQVIQLFRGQQLLTVARSAPNTLYPTPMMRRSRRCRDRRVVTRADIQWLGEREALEPRAHTYPHTYHALRLLETRLGFAHWYISYLGAEIRARPTARSIRRAACHKNLSAWRYQWLPMVANGG